MTDIFILVIEESNCEETQRDLQAFLDIKLCHAYLQKKIEYYKTFEWSNNLRPPLCPSMKNMLSLSNNEVHDLYTFEYQTHDHGAFFSITIFFKKMIAIA